MNTIIAKIAIIFLLIIISILTGNFTRPGNSSINSTIFTIHKLSALALIIQVYLSFNEIRKIMQLLTFDWILLFITFLSLAILLISGGFLSFDKFKDTIFLSFHKIFPWLLFITLLISGIKNIWFKQ